MDSDGGAPRIGNGTGLARKRARLSEILRRFPSVGMTKVASLLAQDDGG